ncbi:hypothetical protein NKH77_20470 [Streptomyces sp. M19]
MALKIRDRIGPYGFQRFFGTYLATPRLRLDRLRMPCLVLGGAEDRAAFPSRPRRSRGRCPTPGSTCCRAPATSRWSSAPTSSRRPSTASCAPSAPGQAGTVRPFHLWSATDDSRRRTEVPACRYLDRDAAPRYEGSNICSWIGFKHVNYLVEEAVLVRFAEAGLSARRLYETYGLGLDLVGLDTRVLHALHLDDVAEAEVRPEAPDDSGAGALSFRVTLRVDRGGSPLKAVSARVRAVLRADTSLAEPAEVPEELARLAVPRLSARRGRRGPGGGAGGEGGAAGADTDRVTAALTEGRNAYAWKWNVRYPYCHFSERLQMSGYLRLMEEAKDRFVDDRGISIRTLLEERSWIPVVPRSSVRILGEALMEEDLYTVYTVEEVFRTSPTPLGWTATSSATASWSPPPPAGSCTATPGSRTAATGGWSLRPAGPRRDRHPADSRGPTRRPPDRQGRRGHRHRRGPRQSRRRRRHRRRRRAGGRQGGRGYETGEG